MVLMLVILSVWVLESLAFRAFTRSTLEGGSKQNAEKQTTGDDEIFQTPADRHQPKDQHSMVPPLPQLAIITIGARLWKMLQFFLTTVGVLLLLAFHLLGGEFKLNWQILIPIVISKLVGFLISRSLTATIKRRRNIAHKARLVGEDVGCGVPINGGRCQPPNEP